MSSHSASFKPASPASIIVSPLQIRKNKNAIMDSPTTDSDVSPVTPAARTAPSRALAPPLPSSRFSSSNQGPSQRHSSKSDRTARKSANVPAIVDPSEFSGLEVDTRKPLPQVPPPEYEMREYGNPYGAQMAHEKDRHFHNYPPNHPALGTGHPAFQPQTSAFQPPVPGISRAPTSGTLGSMQSRDSVANHKHLANERFDQEQAAKAPRKGIFKGRKRFWILVAIIVILVLIGVIVGAVVGTQKRAQPDASPSQTSALASLTPGTPVVTPTAAPDVYDNQLPPGAVHANAPLAAIQFTTNSSEKNAQAGTQNYELYYNNHCGNTAQLQNAGSWRDPNGIIFTDAINGSGMAAMTNWNATRSTHETTVFYVGNDNTLRDKRLTDTTNTFDVGKLIKKKITVPAAHSDDAQANLTKSVTSYSIAAVFSEVFPQGPGARLFYHAQNGSRSYLQEMVYTLASDSWDFGTTIDGTLPTSHLAMVADETNAVVRLMFASDAGNADNTSAPPMLQEYYLPLNHPDTTWTKGQGFSNLLLHPWSQFSLAAGAGSAYLYHVTPMNSSSPALQIRELTLPNANSTDEIRTETAETVAVPEWLSSDTGGRIATTFAPVSAIAGAGYINVFFAHGVVDAEAGYTKLSYVSRSNGNGWGTAGGGSGGGQASGFSDLPLNTKCAKPDI